MPTTIQKVAEWVHALKVEDIPSRVIHKAKLQILSMMAAVYAGYPTRAARIIREVTLGNRASGRSTIFPQGEQTSPANAVIANAAASMALDFDDYLFCGHTGHSAFLSSMALAEEMGLHGRDLLLGQIIGNEVCGRIGASVILGPQNGQLWTHLHAVAAASACSKLLKCSSDQIANAIAISLYQPPFAMWPGFLGPDSKLLSASFPSREGLQAAQLAAWGLTGPLNMLDHPLGFGSYFAYQFLPGMISGFGEVWVSDTLCYKIYPGCAYMDSALDSLFQLQEQFKAEYQRPLEPADILSVTVKTTLFGSEMNRLSTNLGAHPSSSVGVSFSIPFSLSVGCIAGKLTPAELGEEDLRKKQEAILSMASKIEVVHEWSMTMEFIERIGEYLPMQDFFSGLDIKSLLSFGGDMGKRLGGIIQLSPKDLLNLGASLWTRAPRLMFTASRFAANGLGPWVGRKKNIDSPIGLGKAQLQDLTLPFAAEVVIRLRGNRELRHRTDIPSGGTGRDISETTGLVRKKFRDQASPLLSAEKIQKALDLIDHLEELQNLSELTATLTTA